jgi:hypothetical protein
MAEVLPREGALIGKSEIFRLGINNSLPNFLKNK